MLRSGFRLHGRVDRDGACRVHLDFGKCCRLADLCQLHLVSIDFLLQLKSQRRVVANRIERIPAGARTRQLLGDVYDFLGGVARFAVAANPFDDVGSERGQPHRDRNRIHHIAPLSILSEMRTAQPRPNVGQLCNVVI